AGQRLIQRRVPLQAHPPRPRLPHLPRRDEGDRSRRTTGLISKRVAVSVRGGHAAADPSTLRAHRPPAPPDRDRTPPFTVFSRLVRPPATGVAFAHPTGDWCNGSTTDSGSVSKGSNPLSPA